MGHRLARDQLRLGHRFWKTRWLLTQSSRPMSGKEFQMTTTTTSSSPLDGCGILFVELTVPFGIGAALFEPVRHHREH